MKPVATLSWLRKTFKSLTGHWRQIEELSYRPTIFYSGTDTLYLHFRLIRNYFPRTPTYMTTTPQQTDRQTDGWTDGRTTCLGNTALCVASRGKNLQEQEWQQDRVTHIANARTIHTLKSRLTGLSAALLNSCGDLMGDLLRTGSWGWDCGFWWTVCIFLYIDITGDVYPPHTTTILTYSTNRHTCSACVTSYLMTGKFGGSASVAYLLLTWYKQTTPCPEKRESIVF